ncbi:hypothetical protein RhiirA5_445460 [Rhizophagus irregularis]|uniref:Uncharacterized protein n=1 Tax=Rhizophagus irregularis TaxID=588596 RepID=A0A2N0NCE4_9GLOM|nr:hypothetical protein RhiirA5_445460 [Rhizophagus irregularis]
MIILLKSLHHLQINQKNRKERENDNIEDLGSSGNSSNNNQDGLCSFRSIKALLDILVPIWKKGSSSILTPEDTIKLKFGGDGHIVTHQYSHVIFTVCLLNEKDEVLKPSKQYW